MMAQGLITLMKSRKCRLKIDLLSLKEVFRQCMVVLLCQMTLNDGVYIKLVKKLVVSSCSAQNLSDSIDRSILAIDCMKLVVIVQSNRSNTSKFNH